MNTTINKLGNSKGIRIPKPLLDESELGKDVEIVAKRGEIKIIAARIPKKPSETILLSERVLAKDWLKPEEDKAWADL
jgi:antitoxin component of MazEF toxin-antitoxin module